MLKMLGARFLHALVRVVVIPQLTGFVRTLTHAHPQCDVDDIIAYDPPLEQRMKWVDGTNTPYDPFEALRTMTAREIVCPQCQKTQTIRV